VATRWQHSNQSASLSAASKVGIGVFYVLLFVLFFWTFIPAIIGLIEGIIYLTQTDQDFAAKQGVRVV